MSKEITKSNRVPKPIGQYSVASVFENMVFTSGQIGVNPETGEMPRTVEEQTKQVFENLAAVLEAHGSSLRNVIKTTVFLDNMDDFVKMNDVYKDYFTADFPARSAVEVARLPKDALVEIEAVASKAE